jgi:hypothetical protein
MENIFHVSFFICDCRPTGEVSTESGSMKGLSRENFSQVGCRVQ